jgi:acetyltransferase EpsM
MKKIILIGAGGNAAEVREYISYHNQVKPNQLIEVVGFIDATDKFHQKYKFTEPYLGPVEEHQILSDVEYMFCFDNLAYKKKLAEQFKQHGAKFFTFIHPTSLIASTAKIGHGVLISHNVSVGPFAEIADFNIINSRATIAHDTIIGEYNFISPQVALSGNTVIGQGNLMGVNSATIPDITIGNGNTIGAGSILTKSITDGHLIVGVPGKSIKELDNVFVQNR